MLRLQLDVKIFSICYNNKMIRQHNKVLMDKSAINSLFYLLVTDITS